MNQNNKDFKYWLAFSKVDGIGTARIDEILEHFGSMKEAWCASHLDWMVFNRIRPLTVEKFLERKKDVDPDKVLDEICSKGYKVVTYVDDGYPELLKQIHDPPALYYILGDMDLCNLQRCLAVVGSRKASGYILDVLDKLISDLGGTDVTIVSGMALGVDACAHNAALNANLKTIAVLGGGLDNLYPAKNKYIARKIADGNGAVICESYPDARPDQWRFPRRNRIISGLSKGTLVAEAGLKSGALITARLCLEQNRDLMCIPGLLTNPNTSGTHKLLKEGAGLVTSVKDILDHLNWQYEAKDTKKEKSLDVELLDNEARIYEILHLEPVPVDKIVSSANLNIGDIMVALTSLELKGLIKQLPGETYVKALL